MVVTVVVVAVAVVAVASPAGAALDCLNNRNVSITMVMLVKNPKAIEAVNVPDRIPASWMASTNEAIPDKKHNIPHMAARTIQPCCPLLVINSIFRTNTAKIAVKISQSMTRQSMKKPIPPKPCPVKRDARSAHESRLINQMAAAVMPYGC